LGFIVDLERYFVLVEGMGLEVSLLIVVFEMFYSIPPSSLKGILYNEKSLTTGLFYISLSFNADPFVRNLIIIFSFPSLSS